MTGFAEAARGHGLSPVENGDSLLRRRIKSKYYFALFGAGGPKRLTELVLSSQGGTHLFSGTAHSKGLILAGGAAQIRGFDPNNDVSPIG